MLLVVCLCLGVSFRDAAGQSFTVTAGASALTIHPGDSNVALPVSLSSTATDTDPVTVTLTGLPSGISVVPLELVPGQSGTLEISASVFADQESFADNAPSNPNTATSQITVLAFSGSVQSTATLALTVSLTNPSFKPATVNLPIVNINTSGVPVTSKTTDVAGTITITSADGSTTYLPDSSDSDDTATFHVHGTTTAMMPKLAYDVKLNTSLDLLATMGLTCPYVGSSGKAVCDKSKSYILLANYDDKPMLRDWSASALANAIPYGGNYLNETPVPAPYTGVIPTPSGTSALMPWAPHSLFVEVYLNGVYEGAYQLIEEIKVDSHRVNIPELTDTDTSGDLSGGYLLEIDSHETEDYVFITPKNLAIGLIDPDFTPEVPEQTSYINNYVNAAEAALFSNSFTDPTIGWRAYFDEATAVNFYIVNDLMGNVDGGDFYSSDYFYKAPDNPFLYMGPVWDFDVSSGNVNYEPIIDPTTPWTTTHGVWYTQWFQDPGFKAAATQQWNALKNNGVLSSWIASIPAEAATLEQSQANNFGRWPMQGIRVWPNPEAVGSYNAEVNYLVDWIKLRMGYMDAFLNGTPLSSTALTVPPGTLRSGTPVTLSAKVTGNSPTGTVTFSYDSIILGEGALDGAGTATLTTSSIAAGNWYLEAYYDGDSQNRISGALGAELTVLPPLVETATNLTGSAVSINYGSPVTLTGAVAGVSGRSEPTGTIAFSVNGASLGSAAVSSSGIASLTTSALPAGSDPIQATYSGDLNHATSVSNTVAIQTSQLTAADFSFTNTGVTYQTVLPGSGTSFAFALAPLSGAYPGSVSFTVTGLPANSTYTLSPAFVAATAAARTLTLTVRTSAASTAAAHDRETWKGSSGLALAAVLLPFCLRRRTRSALGTRVCWLIVLLGSAGVLAGLTGCAAGKGVFPPASTNYNLTVLATSGTVQHAAAVTLNVQ